MSRVSLAALGLLTLGFAVTLGPGPWGDERVNDLFVYRTYAEHFLGGVLPYRDVAFEYPPLAAPLLALPGLAGTGEEAYRLVFAALALALAASVVLLVGAIATRTGAGASRGRAMLAAASMPLLCGAMIRTHFDLAPVALTLAALALLCADRPRAGLALLGAGVATKLFPLVVGPIALAWLLARGRRRDAVQGALALVAVVAVCVGAAVALSPTGAADAVTYHLDRPLQIESSPALLLLGADALGAGEARVVNSHGSDGVEHPAADVATALFTALLVGVLALLTAAAARRPDPRTLVLAGLTACVAFAALGKVLSPQFLIWAVPLGALALAWRMHALGALVALAALLTLVEFPAHYLDVVAREPAALWLVAARDAVLIAAVAVATGTVLKDGRRSAGPIVDRAEHRSQDLTASPAPAGGSARSPWHGRPRRPRPAQR